MQERDSLTPMQAHAGLMESSVGLESHDYPSKFNKPWRLSSH